MKKKSGENEHKKRRVSAKSQTDWERVDAMTDEEAYAAALADPDAQPTDEAFWADAELVKLSR